MTVDEVVRQRGAVVDAFRRGPIDPFVAIVAAPDLEAEAGEMDRDRERDEHDQAPADRAAGAKFRDESATGPAQRQPEQERDAEAGGTLAQAARQAVAGRGEQPRRDRSGRAQERDRRGQAFRSGAGRRRGSLLLGGGRRRFRRAGGHVIRRRRCLM